MGKLKFIILIFLWAMLSAGHSAEISEEAESEKEEARLQLESDKFVALPHKDKFDVLSKDPKNRVHDFFNISPFFDPSVHFWFNIYTLYDSSFSIIHDKGDLGIIYKVMDYTSLSSSKLSRFTKASLQKQYTRTKVKLVRKALKNLAKGRSKGAEEKAILEVLKKANKKIPHNRRKKRLFFLELSKNLRSQTGQKDMIIEAMLNFAPYANKLYPIFEEAKLPKELLLIPFLESSFNVKAISKVGAAGVWQFMPNIAKHFMKQTRSVDSRLSPLIATVGAVHLLKQNKKILKRWDLAIAAYNSGTRHILRARKKLKKINLPLEEMLQGYEHPHVGFAAQNFYSEFLALVYAFEYKEELYPNVIIEDFNNLLGSKVLKAYVTKCPVIPKRIYRLLKKSSPNFRDMNKHLKYTKVRYPRGTILVSDVTLTKRKYRQVSFSEMVSRYPKNWRKLVRGHKCSKR